MGASGSRDDLSSLPPMEKDALSKTFHAVTTVAKGASEKDFCRFFNEEIKWSIPEKPLKCLYTTMCGGTQPPGVLPLQLFLKHCGLLLGHGSPSDRHQLLYSLHVSLESRTVTVDSVSEMLAVFIQLLCMAPMMKEVFPHATDWDVNKNTCEIVSCCLTKELAGKETQSGSVSVDRFVSWLSQAPVVEIIYTTLFSFMFLHHGIGTVDLRQRLAFTIDPESGRKSYDSLLVPELMQIPFHPSNYRFSSDLLDMGAVMFLNSFLPGDAKGRLFPLFSSRQHGESFSTFVGRIVKQGPILLVLRDTGGHVFGGFSSQSWSIGPEFTGSPSCFLYTLYPSVGVYDSTGYNSNYMYLEQNAQTLPNGLGMGGQLNYFGLWISGDYGSGHSMARPTCTTYGSPTLSSTEEFKIDCLEAWGVGDPPEPEVKDKSILDKDKTAQTLLDLAGKTRHSEGLRTPVESDEETN